MTLLLLVLLLMLFEEVVDDVGVAFELVELVVFVVVLIKLNVAICVGDAD